VSELTRRGTPRKKAPGQGRKPGPDGPLRPREVSIGDTQWAALGVLGGSRSAHIRAAVAAYLEGQADD
jgi:hypothetical protein